MLILATSFQYSIEVPARRTRQGKEIKAIQIRNKEVKLYLFADEISIYAEYTKHSLPIMKKQNLLIQLTYSIHINIKN